MKFLVLTVFACVLWRAFAMDDPAAEEFTNDLAQSLQKNAAKLLDIANVPQDEAGKVYYKVVKKYLSDRGAKNAEEIAKSKSESVAQNYDKLKPKDVSYQLGKILVSGLKKLGKLNKENAAKLASEAGQDFKQVVSDQDTSSPEGKVEALLKSYNKFLERFGHSYPELADVMNKASVDFMDSAQ